MVPVLERIRVLDLTRALSGPFCATLLGDLGAEVTKVEPVSGGDMIRGWGPFAAGESLYYLASNRNKRSVAIDPRSAGGQGVLRRLCARSDVLVENFRPGVMAAMGLDEAALRRDYPRLVYCSITGFGPVGPYSGLAGFDQVVQGMAGLMSVTGPPGEPTRVGVAVGDLLSGVFAALGICAALAQRGVTGHAPRVETSLFESVLGLMSFQAQRYLTLGQVPVSQGNDHPLICPYGTFEAQDGLFNLAVGTDDQWRKLCSALGDPPLGERADLAGNTGRMARRDEVKQLLNDRFRARAMAEWLALLAPLGIPCGPIYRMDQVLSDPQTERLGMVQEVPHPLLGTLRLLRGPLWFDGAPMPVRRSPPVLGQHTRPVLRSLDYSDEQVETLLAGGEAYAAPTASGGEA